LLFVKDILIPISCNFPSCPLQLYAMSLYFIQNKSSYTHFCVALFFSAPYQCNTLTVNVRYTHSCMLFDCQQPFLLFIHFCSFFKLPQVRLIWKKGGVFLFAEAERSVFEWGFPAPECIRALLVCPYQIICTRQWAVVQDWLIKKMCKNFLTSTKIWLMNSVFQTNFQRWYTNEAQELLTVKGHTNSAYQ